jgi:1,4-alpha-glucan branching enzyme
MKHNKNHDNVPDTKPKTVLVHFEFSHPTALAVFIAGTFNDWHPTAKPMHALDGGNWSKETNLVPGTYEYCLIVDGQWLADPLARETMPNPFGGRNSVLRVISPERAHIADAAELPLKNQN